jgi:hypothetical protein
MAGFRFALSLVLCGDFIQQCPRFAFDFDAGVLVGNVSRYCGDGLRGIPYGFDWAALFFQVPGVRGFGHASR